MTTDVLAGRGVGRLVVSGAETDACVRSTLHGAPGRTAGTATAAEAVLASPGP